MYITCLDLEGVLVPEIWIAFAEASGIPELKKTAGVSTRTFVNGARLKNFSDFEVNLNIKPDEGSGSGSGSGTGTGTGTGSGGSDSGGTGGSDA